MNTCQIIEIYKIVQEDRYRADHTDNLTAYLRVFEKRYQHKLEAVAAYYVSSKEVDQLQVKIIVHQHDPYRRYDHCSEQVSIEQVSEKVPCCCQSQYSLIHTVLLFSFGDKVN